MDTPINLAHQQDRRAEALLMAGKFQEAIICHQKAADFLLEAMKMTSVPKALTSMELQHEKHLKEQKMLHFKWERFKHKQKQMMQSEGGEDKHQELHPDNSPLDSDIQEEETSNNTNTSFHFFEQPESGNLVISADHLSVFSISSADSITSSMKDDKIAASSESNRVHDLEMQVLTLSQALEDANRENTRLKNTITRIVERVKEQFGVDFDPGSGVCDSVEGVAHEDAGQNFGMENGHLDTESALPEASLPDDVAELPPLELPAYELT